MKKKIIGIIVAIVVLLGLGLIICNQIIPNEYEPADDEIVLHIHLDIEEVITHVKSCFNAETIGMHYPSMHQDLIKNHRLTEIDYINGAISRKGRKYGVATPYCDFLTQLVHAKEQILGVK